MTEDTKKTSPVKKKRFGFLMVGGFLIPFVILLFVILGYSGWQLTYNPKTSCNLCHNIQPYVKSYFESTYLDSAHADANVGCKDCHEASVFSVMGEGWKYITGSYKTPMREIEFSKEQCLECHRSYSSLIEQTSDLKPNPHDSPHSLEAECSTCHKSHRESTILCSQCHQVDYDIAPFSNSANEIE